MDSTRTSQDLCDEKNFFLKKLFNLSRKNKTYANLRRRINNNVKKFLKKIIERIYKMIINTHRRILHYFKLEFKKGTTGHDH